MCPTRRPVVSFVNDNKNVISSAMKNCHYLCLALLSWFLGQESSTNGELNISKRTVIKEHTTTQNKFINQSLQSVDAFSKKSSHEPDATDRETLARNSDRVSSNLLTLNKSKKDQQQPLQQAIQQDVHQHKLNLPQRLDNETIEFTTSAEEMVLGKSLTEEQRLMRHFWIQRRLLIEGQYAYLCILFLVCLMLASFWWMRGFHFRHERKMAVSFNNESNLMTVKEVLIMKARYLPMFHQKDEFCEVLIHDRGNDP